MRVRNALRSLAIKSLYESLDVRMIIHAASQIIENYDIYERTGCPRNIPLTAQQTARQVIDDCIAFDMFLDLLEYLIILNSRGYMGREFPILYLDEMIKHVNAEGFLYNPETNRFMEDTSKQATMNWGRLHEGSNYSFTFLKIDIVRNSEHVRSNKKADVESAYRHIHAFIANSFLKRDGREWFWEGDGGLIAFFNGDIYNNSVLTGIDIINKLNLYNIFDNKLQKPVALRISCHAGTFPFSSNAAVIRKYDPIREALEIESKHTPENELSVTVNVYPRLDKLLTDSLTSAVQCDKWKLYYYKPSMEFSCK